MEHVAFEYKLFNKLKKTATDIIIKINVRHAKSFFWSPQNKA